MWCFRSHTEEVTGGDLESLGAGFRFFFFTTREENSCMFSHHRSLLAALISPPLWPVISAETQEALFWTIGWRTLLLMCSLSPGGRHIGQLSSPSLCQHSPAWPAATYSQSPVAVTQPRGLFRALPLSSLLYLTSYKGLIVSHLEN